MTKPIFDSLGLTFDTSKFGEALDPLSKLKDTNMFMPAPLRKWQYDAIVNGEVSETLYLKNPVGNVINSISVTANSLYVTVNTYNGLSPVSVLPEIRAVSANLVNTCNTFLRHTQRLSGLETSTNLAKPDLSTSQGFGQQAINILSKFEDVGNNSPILGSMTSLFVEDDLLTYYSGIQSFAVEITNSISFVSGLPGYYASSLGSPRIAEIAAYIESANTFMNTREQHDIKFYGNVRKLSNNYITMLKFSGFTDLGAHLVENYIGTDKLKEKL